MTHIDRCNRNSQDHPIHHHSRIYRYYLNEHSDQIYFGFVPIDRQEKDEREKLRHVLEYSKYHFKSIIKESVYQSVSPLIEQPFLFQFHLGFAII